MTSFNHRTEELKNLLNKTFQSMGDSRKIELLIYENPFPTMPPSAASTSTGGKVCFPLTVFISPQELPLHLRVETVDDPKLNEDSYFDQLSSWLTQTYTLPAWKATWEDKEAFKLYVRYMQNPEMAKKGFEFVWNHELEHVFRKHGEQKIPLYAKILLVVAAIVVGGLVGLLCSTGIGAIVLGTIFFGIALLTGYLGLKILQSKSHEWEADLGALHRTSDIEGPVYLFQQIQAQGRESRNDPQAPWIAKLLITPAGDFIPRAFTHQLESNRIVSLQKEFARMQRFPSTTPLVI